MSKARRLKTSEYESFKNAFTGEYKLRNRVLFVLGVRSGFRIAELLSLKVGDIIEPTGRLAERITVERGYIKRHRESRSVPIHPEFAAVMRDYCAWLATRGQNGASRPLFPGRSGEKLTPRDYWRIMKASALRLGISPKGISPHAMRKTFASLLITDFNEALRRGANIVPLQCLKIALGHESIESTDHYVPENEDLVNSAIAGTK